MSIRVDGIRKTFGGFAALDDISLNVPQGELVGLLGPSGTVTTRPPHCTTQRITPGTQGTHDPDTHATMTTALTPGGTYHSAGAQVPPALGTSPSLQVHSAAMALDR